MRNFKDHNFKKFFAVILASELLTVLTALLLLNMGISLWIHRKTAELVRVADQAVASADWSRVDKIEKGKPNSPIFRNYLKTVRSLNKQLFPQNDGDISIAVVKGGEEYLAVADNTGPLEDYGKASPLEFEAYTGKAVHSPQPYADINGTHLTALAPIFKSGRVIALLAADFDSASLNNFKGVVRMAFWWSIVPALLLSLLVAFFLASRFVEPIAFLREVKEAEQAAVSSSKESSNPQWASLSPREKEVALYVSQGLENNEIAEKMTVSPETVKKHLKNIFQKLEISNRTSLALIAMRQSESITPSCPVPQKG